eukprot:3871103-Pyramimonas_sp.AAC.1
MSMLFLRAPPGARHCRIDGQDLVDPPSPSKNQLSKRGGAPPAKGRSVRFVIRGGPREPSRYINVTPRPGIPAGA